MISVVVISKDEPALDATLRALREQADRSATATEILVVDASAGRLAAIRDRHRDAVRWIDYAQPPGVGVTIPHQRNVGVRSARGDVIVFTDCGCAPERDWLAALVAPILEGDEDVCAGVTLATSERGGIYDAGSLRAARETYLQECPTINVAFRRRAFDAAGAFDESFEYGSDVEFSWRLVDRGHRIRSVPEAIVRHDWGSPRRQLKRSFQYGRARARLYLKHPRRRRSVWRRDPMVVAYPAYILGLPLALLSPAYLALLAIPAWRNRESGAVRVLADHLAFGAGVLSLAVRR